MSAGVAAAAPVDGELVTAAGGAGGGAAGTGIRPAARLLLPDWSAAVVKIGFEPSSALDPLRGADGDVGSPVGCGAACPAGADGADCEAPAGVLPDAAPDVLADAPHPASVITAAPARTARADLYLLMSMPRSAL